MQWAMMPSHQPTDIEANLPLHAASCCFGLFEETAQ
jgi:hypothetical protein